LAALRLQQPDRVPYFDLCFNEQSILNVGKFFTSDLPPVKPLIDCRPEEVLQYQELQSRIIRELDIDGLSTVFHTGRSRIPEKPHLLRDRYGIVYRITDHGNPYPVEGPIKAPGDMKSFKAMVPNPSDFRSLRYLSQTLPDRFLLLTTPGTFRFSWSMLGALEKLLFYYVTNPDLCLEIARITTDFTKGVIEMAVDEGADGIVLEGDLAMKTNTFMSPDHYRRFIKPFHQEICETAHSRGVPIIKHTDGNIWPILNDLVEAGFDGIHPIQPQSMDIVEVKEKINGRTCILGNIDCTYLLPFGTEEEVVASVIDTIRKVAPGGGYILSSSNSIHPGCKGENVIAMFKTAKKYGVYPISI